MAGDETRRANEIARLNDHLRRTLTGGKVVITPGIAALAPEIVQAILTAVQESQAFTPANDPWDEHDCAVLTVQGTRILWKIDCYDHSMNYASPDPTDPSATTRVLTVMLPEEY